MSHEAYVIFDTKSGKYIDKTGWEMRSTMSTNPLLVRNFGTDKEAGSVIKKLNTEMVTEGTVGSLTLVLCKITAPEVEQLLSATPVHKVREGYTIRSSGWGNKDDSYSYLSESSYRSRNDGRYFSYGQYFGGKIKFFVFAHQAQEFLNWMLEQKHMGALPIMEVVKYKQ